MTLDYEYTHEIHQEHLRLANYVVRVCLCKIVNKDIFIKISATAVNMDNY